MKIISICCVIALALFFLLTGESPLSSEAKFSMTSFFDDARSNDARSDDQSRSLGQAVTSLVDEDDHGDDDDDDEVPSRVLYHEGLAAVNLPAHVIEHSGIQLISLEQTQFSQRTQAVAEVLDIGDLLMLQGQYQQLQAKLEGIEKARQSKQKIYQRLRLLHRERAKVSLTQVEEARAQLSHREVEALATQKQLKMLQQQAQLIWGKTLSDALFSIPTATEDQPGNKSANASEANYFDQLMKQDQLLLMLTLPSAAPPLLQVSSPLNPQQHRPARLISAAKQNNAQVPGLTYFYHTDAQDLRVGMKLNVWKQQEAEQLFQLPLSAVIWYAGQAWVYQQVADDLYARRAITDYQQGDDSWFVKTGFEVGDRIVSKGGQLLLSEELRWQIPDEDDD